MHEILTSPHFSSNSNGRVAARHRIAICPCMVTQFRERREELQERALEGNACIEE